MSHAVAIANNNNAARQSFDRINGNNKKAKSMSPAVAIAKTLLSSPSPRVAQVNHVSISRCKMRRISITKPFLCKAP